MKAFLKALLAFFKPKTIDMPTPVPQPQPQPIVEPHGSYIVSMAKAIAIFEGAKPYLNNPGNVKGLNGKFIQFKTYDEGFAYLCDYLTRACTGKHPAYKPTTTINQFFHIYTSDKEPVPTNYALFVAKHIGKDVNTQIKDLV